MSHPLPPDHTPVDRPVDAELVSHIQLYQGPLPPATEFAAYEQAYPGAADRILRMAERDQAARISDQRQGRLIGFVLDLLAHVFLYGLVAAAVYLAVRDKPVEALLAGLAPMVIAVYANVRKHSHAQDDQDST